MIKTHKDSEINKNYPISISGENPFLIFFTKLTQLFPSSSPVALGLFNVFFVLIYGFGMLLEKAGIPYATVLTGGIVLIAPGFCLALLFEQLSEVRTRPLILMLWILLFTAILTPAAVSAISIYGLGNFPVNDITVPFIFWWAVCFVLAAIVGFFKRQPTVFMVPDSQKKGLINKDILWILGVFFVVMIANFIAYPFLPEGDGYGYLLKWKSIQTDPQLFATEPRSLFLVLTHMSAFLQRIDIYWVLKVFFPLSHLILLLSCYFFVGMFIPSRPYRILLTLVPLSFPVVVQESLISRPQSLFLIALLPILAIITSILKDRKNMHQAYWLAAILALGLVGMKIHTLFALIIAVALFSILIFFKSEIKRNPIDALIIILGLFLLLYPYLAETRILSDSVRLTKLFATSIAKNKFDFWFIDHYRNVDGAEVGWPGILSWLYYGYNLGFVLPVLALLAMVPKLARNLKRLLCKEYWALLSLILFFFFIAEFAPRFQLAYLPDRAWLFLSLLMSPVLIVFVAGLRPWENRRVFPIAAILLTISIFASIALTYVKQGWVTRPEVMAAKFLRTHTANNSLILGPGSTRVMVRYYAQREFLRPNDTVFLTGEKKELNKFISSLYVKDDPEQVLRRREHLVETLKSVTKEIEPADVSEMKLSEQLTKLSELQKNQEKYFFQSSDEQLNRPIYLVFNENKFHSLYGQRDWWKKSNFYGAALEKLGENYRTIYNKGGIIIWEANK